jgi:hypothetical protein
MSKQSTFNFLPHVAGALCLAFLAGSQNTSAADLGADPQVQAAHLLQHQITWSTGADRFQLFSHSAGNIYSSQEQAQRILQPINDIAVAGAEYAGSSLFTTSAPIAPQLQAAKMLNHNFGCRPFEC